MGAEFFKMKIENIEAEFDTVVKKIGGTPIRELIASKSPDFENADYLFPQEKLIAELKILENDPTANGALQRKIQGKFDKWMTEGKFLAYGTVRVESKTLPLDIQWELARIYSEPVRRVIKKANRQIRDTKKFLNLPDAKGLVIVVNEANRELQPEHFAFAAHQSLGDDYSAIHGVSLLTINVETTKSDIPSRLHLWIDYIRDKPSEIDQLFMERFRKDWTEHYASLIGEPVPLLDYHGSDLTKFRYI